MPAHEPGTDASCPGDRKQQRDEGHDHRSVSPKTSGSIRDGLERTGHDIEK